MKAGVPIELQRIIQASVVDGANQLRRGPRGCDSIQPAPATSSETPAGSDELGRLAEELHRVLEDDATDEALPDAAAAASPSTKRGTAIGSLGPQSQAPATRIRSGP